jgi:hypothetical protein
MVTASAGLGLIFLTTPPANAIVIAPTAGIRHAADALDLTEAVHCRKYSHRHKRGHRSGRGCGAEVIVRPPRSGIMVPERGGNVTSPRVRVPPLSASPTAPRRGANPSNPQDRLGTSNPQDMTVPRAINPQDMR